MAKKTPNKRTTIGVGCIISDSRLAMSNRDLKTYEFKTLKNCKNKILKTLRQCIQKDRQKINRKWLK